jgi:ectoine hydroxylase-related dioxygenase (phytanoyl-CoA dioxygenase family)
MAKLSADNDVRVGDKPHGGTARMTDVIQRVPSARLLPDALEPVVEQIIGPDPELTELAFRCPQPGHGEQRLHADDVAKLDDGPDRCATAIVALVDFTDENGATRLVPGSHRRRDLQQQSGALGQDDRRVRDQLVTLAGPAGTAFVFSGHLLHGGGRNRSDRSRPALQLTYRSSRHT